MNDSAQHERLIRFLARTQERLLRYVFVLLPDWDSALEIVQNTHVVVWQKATEFKSDSEDDYFRWAKQIAFYETKKYMTRRAAGPYLLDPDLAALISDEFNEIDTNLDVRQQALSTCIDKLATKDRELLRLRYWDDESVAALSAQLGRTVDAIYKSLQRIRQALLLCIEREVKRKDR